MPDRKPLVRTCREINEFIKNLPSIRVFFFAISAAYVAIIIFGIHSFGFGETPDACFRKNCTQKSLPSINSRIHDSRTRLLPERHFQLINPAVVPLLDIKTHLLE